MVKRLYKESLLKQEFVFIIAILLLNSCIKLENWQRGAPMQFKYKDGSRPSEHCIPYISFVYEVDKCSISDDEQNCIIKTRKYYSDQDTKDRKNYKRFCKKEKNLRGGI